MKTEIHSPKICELLVRTVRVPMQQPHQTTSGTISESPLVLTDVTTEDGTVGHSMIFTYTVAALRPTADLIRNLESLVKGEALAPAEMTDRLAKSFRLLGMQGLVAMAVAAVDMALWDALARSHSTSLVRLLGGTESQSPPTAQSATTAWQVLPVSPNIGQNLDSRGSRRKSVIRRWRKTFK